jgi:hypothetical protein
VLRSLSELDLSTNRIGSDGVKALAQAPHLADLVRLDLTSNPIGPEGARALVESSSLSGLAWLKVSVCLDSEALLRKHFQGRVVVI